MNQRLVNEGKSLGNVNDNVAEFTRRVTECPDTKLPALAGRGVSLIQAMERMAA